MPELPEVEQVRRGLHDAKLTRVTATWRSAYDLRTGATWARAREHIGWLEGAQSLGLRRRGKHLLWDFESEKGQLCALIHLGMTGRFEVHARGDRRELHTHISLQFDDGRRVDYVDARRFGGFVVDAREAVASREPLVSMGPEPLEPGFCGDELQARAGASRRPIRQALLDQRVVAGMGNIYVSEALFLAKIPPLARCHRLRPSAWARLAKATVKVLRDGLARGGTTLRDYRRVDGSQGQNQLHLLAYGRAGQKCVSCAARLVAHDFQGRSGVHCPDCQRPAPGGWVR